MLSRRRLLLSSLPTALALGLSRRAHAATTDRRFLFVWNDGGWDPLCFAAPLFDSDTTQMQRGAARMDFGDLALVDHAERPAVRAFFEANASRIAVVNGISVPSVSHDICALLALTGGSGGDRPDWPTRLAQAAEDRYTLPSVVVTGPSFTADRGAISSRVGAGGQLQDLLDGTCFDLGEDLPARGLSASTRARVDRLVVSAAARRAGTGEALAVDFDDSLRRANALVARSSEIDLGAFSDLDGQLSVAVRALSLGLCRCVTVSSGAYKLYWDSHASNDAIQSPAFESLFGSLGVLAELLGTTPSPAGGMLIDDTVVVVLSEMGRTPRYNASDGRDHWPYTSALLFGGGVVGGQTVSGYDDGLHGLGYDPDTGDAVDADTPVTPEQLGATLLTLADTDPESALPGVSPLRVLLP